MSPAWALGLLWAVVVVVAAQPRGGAAHDRAALLVIGRPGRAGAPVPRWAPGQRRRAVRPGTGARGAPGVVVLAALGVGGALVVGPVPVAAVGAGLVLRRARRRRRRAGHAEALVVEALPEVVDLVRVAIDAGSTVPLALRAVAPLAPPPFAAALAAVVVRTDRGARLADALDLLPAVLGEPVRPLAAALQGAERYGSPLAEALDRIATDVRRERRQRAEEAARTLPVRLIFPLVLCTLPSLVLLTIAPVVAGAVQSLRL